MLYTVRKISLRSALRVGLVLGWLVALLPAAGLAGLCVLAIQQASAAFGQMSPYELSFLGQTVASLDPLAFLGLADTAASLRSMADRAGALFALLTAGLTIVGGLGVALTTLLFSLCYNLIAAVGGGLRVELGAGDERLRDAG
ncbi:MAG TPA: hypothetical protein PKD53_20320 [Chloroflexaceae bacterium]|nr:hypothetical protein [Chloroflexaceae bacterium]